MADNNYTLKTMENEKGNGKRNRQKKIHFTKCFLKPGRKSWGDGEREVVKR